jgi:GNAT superfamily N-acetyltransferase
VGPGDETIPTGEATEITPERVELGEEPIPTGEATELTPELIEADKKWRTDHQLGEEDAGRARDVARALGYDEKAVEAAVRQHERSPRAFDREIARINEEGQTHETQTEQTVRSSESDAARAERAGASGGGDGTSPVWQSETNAKPTSAVRAESEPARPDSTSAARAGVEIREVPGGFDAYKDGKKVGYLRDNLERGQAKQLGENANVNIVKVDKELQGSGIGRALYEAFNEKHDGRIMPSGKTEPPAWKLWKRNYPEKVDQFVKDEAARIRGGADAQIVARNITDPEVRARVLKESERGPDTQPDNQPGRLQQEDRNKGKPEESEEIFKENGEEPAQNRGGAANAGRRPVGSAEAMDAVLREKFGDKFIQGLVDQGILKYEAASPRRANIGATLNQGSSTTKPAATLYYKTLTAEQTPGVLMHELGEHFGIVRLLGEKRYGVMLDELKALRRTPEVQEAWSSVKSRYVDRGSKLTEGGPTFMREVAARLVEDHPDLPFVRRLINEVRAFFYERFGTTLGNRVDAGLIRGLAASALRKASEGTLADMQKPIVPFVRSRPAGGAARPIQ